MFTRYTHGSDSRVTGLFAELLFDKGIQFLESTFRLLAALKQALLMLLRVKFPLRHFEFRFGNLRGLVFIKHT